jgi:hypothetical protein
MKELAFRKGEKIKIGKRGGFESQQDKNIAKDNCADSERRKWHFVFFLAFGFSIPIPNF